MSRTIKDSMDLLEQSLNDCKTALTEKGVADVEAIKISDVNEKIAEIQAGGVEEVKPPIKIKSLTISEKTVEDRGEIRFGFKNSTPITVNVEKVGEDVSKLDYLYFVDFNFKLRESINIRQFKESYSGNLTLAEYGEGFDCYILVLYKNTIIQVFKCYFDNENYS